MRLLLELRRFGRAVERGRRRLAGDHDLGHLVEVAGADLALVARGGVAVLLRGELGLLQLASTPPCRRRLYCRASSNMRS